MIRNDHINLGPSIQFLLGKWKIIIGTGVVFASVGGGLAFAAKPIWAVKSTLILPPPEGEAANLLGLGSVKPSAILHGVLKSRTVMEDVAKQSRMSLREVDDMVSIELDHEAGQVTFVVASEDKQLGVAMVNTALSALDRTRAQVSTRMAKRQANLLQYVADEKREALDRAVQDVLAFQRTAKTVPDPSKPFSGSTYLARLEEAKFNLETIKRQIERTRSTLSEQASASIEIPLLSPKTANSASVPTWRDRLIQLEYELQIAEIVKGPLSPDVIRLKEQIALTRQRAQTEVNKYLQGLSSGLDRNIVELEAKKLLLEQEVEYLEEVSSVAPVEDAIVQRLIRNVRFREEEYKSVVIMLNEAQLRSQVDKLEWTVLTSAYLEEQPINKRPFKTTVSWFIVGLLLSGSLLLLNRSRSAR